jgi:vesicle coat complex subunit
MSVTNNQILRAQLEEVITRVLAKDPVDLELIAIVADMSPPVIRNALLGVRTKQDAAVAAEKLRNFASTLRD